MKAINKKAQKVLETLISKMEGGYAKIDNADGVFMPVIVEDIGDGWISVAHYRNVNGDLCPDPEMVFWKAPDGRYYPTYFKDFIFERESVFFEGDKPVRIFERMQHDQATFAGMWLQNIKQQQRL